MKIAITTQGTDLNGEVDPRFGRAMRFIVVDTDSEEFVLHDNSQNLNAVQGAGIQAARNIVELGASAVVTGNVGPKAFVALQAAGIEVYIGASGTVRDALEQFKAGKLAKADQPNVGGHWA
jgi:predicted Fe-Mo cluster-binding NifX family protein